jgi:hypothetical protein
LFQFGCLLIPYVTRKLSIVFIAFSCIASGSLSIAARSAEAMTCDFITDRSNFQNRRKNMLKHNETEESILRNCGGSLQGMAGWI